jgi:hypothetical protein
VKSPIKMMFATVAFGAGLSATGAAYAADDATLNKCWGQTTKEFQAVGEPGLGEHASNPPGIDPGEGREGVGNVSKGFGELGDGAQGKHAIAVAPSSIEESLPEECQGTEMP